MTEPAKRRKPVMRRGRAAMLALLGIAAGLAGAQVPVRDSAAAAEAAPAAGDAARLGELFHRLQVLEREIAELRGLVEEQTFRIERLTSQQKAQYIDLDQRLVALRRDAPAERSGAPASARPAPAGGAPALERNAYTAAFNLMKESRFEESADAFNRLIADYPNGQYTPNAFYWIGELNLAMDEVEQARQSFAQVLALYPEHGKVPDALYKLGVVHHRLDDNERALEHLDRVVAEYPNSTAAGLARTYKAELE